LLLAPVQLLLKLKVLLLAGGQVLPLLIILVLSFTGSGLSGLHLLFGLFLFAGQFILALAQELPPGFQLGQRILFLRQVLEQIKHPVLPFLEFLFQILHQPLAVFAFPGFFLALQLLHPDFFFRGFQLTAVRGPLCAVGLDLLPHLLNFTRRRFHIRLRLPALGIF